MILRHCLAALAVLGCVVSAAPARGADVGLYVTPKLSWSIQSLDDLKAKGTGGTSEGLDSGYDGTWGMGAALGFDLYPRFMVPARLEVEYMYMGEAEQSGSTNHLFASAGNFSYAQKNSVSSVFVNAYLDMHTGSMLTPYAGVGLGTAWVKSRGNLAGEGLGSNTETNLAWNLGLGLAFEIDYNTSIDLGYRYASFGKAKTGAAGNGHLESTLGMHQINLGLRYTF
ncbi:MAG: porin family protein [Desulfovibrionaceae bacterium]|nr:porin family protein [Desulfovibrionaceae bacterium]